MISALIEAALRSLLVALTVGAGLCLLRVRNVLAQKAAWGLVLVSAVGMPVAMRWNVMPGWVAIRLPVAGSWLARSGSAVPAVPLTAQPLRDASATAEPVPVPGDRFPAPVVSTAKLAPPAPAATPPSAQMSTGPAGAGLRLPDPATLAWDLYLAGCTLLLLRLIYGLGSAVRLWRAAEPVSIGPGSKLRFGPAMGMYLRSSPLVASPVTIGSGVVLPANYAEWDQEKLRIVLAHEQAHLRQGDFYLQVLAGVYAAVFWFSPLGWWLKRKLSDLGEAISDRAGLEEAASRSSYAQILLEFAALPRPTLVGVAMARSTSLSHRIERLLNDSTFRQAFAGSRGRALLAVLLVPTALFAATALIRVEAAGQATGQAAPPAHLEASAQSESNPDPVAERSELPAQPPAAPPSPVAPAAAPAPVGPGTTMIPEGAPDTPPPPAPPDGAEPAVAAWSQATATASAQATATAKRDAERNEFRYRWSSNGDSWALVTDSSDHVTFNGDWHNSTRETIDKVRKVAGNRFLWFTRDGKSYFVDDPALIEQIQEMYKPMEALGRQQEELGRQQEELGKEQEKLGRRQELASIPTPDISKEMAELNAAAAKLEAKKGKTVSQQELAELEGKMGEIQGRLGGLQGMIGEQQGKLGAMQGELGAKQGKLGAEQGRLGAEQGRIAVEADRKVKTIIEESLHNGKARPVE